MREEKQTEFYKDKNGKDIKPKQILVHDDGQEEEVFLTEDGDLGFNASNPNFIGYNPLNVQLYPLYQFNMREWQIKE